MKIEESQDQISELSQLPLQPEESPLPEIDKSDIITDQS